MDPNLLDRWERNDQQSLAPLSENQQKFLDNLIDLIKDPDDDEDHIKNDAEKSFSQNDDLSFDNLQDFNVWFNDVEHRIQLQNNEQYQQIQKQYKLCQNLAKLIDTIMKNLNQLDQQYYQSIDKIKQFHQSCEQILQQQQNLILKIDSINEKLLYFEDYDKLSKKFSQPTILILNESLITLLKRLDDCIEFMSANKNNFLECSTYLQKYRQFQLSALNLIKQHFLQTLKQNEHDVMPENDNVLTTNESIFTLYYGKFQLNSQRLKILVQQIENRTKYSEIYTQYLSECHQCYFQIRQNLIIPVLTLAMDEMIDTNIHMQRNYCLLIRSSLKLFIQICHDEYQLYFQFFTHINDKFNEFLDSICSILNDKLRPIIIHLEHLELLSEICQIIKYEFLDDQTNDRGTNDDGDLISFTKCIEQLLQDTQERLVYRCNVHIDRNILNYQPVSGDLAYPEKLRMMKSISETIEHDNSGNQQVEIESSIGTSGGGNGGRIKRSDSVSSIISSISDISFVRGYHHQQQRGHRDSIASSITRPVSSRATVDLHGMWYPTVRSSIMVLSKLYRSLDKLTFQGLSQEVLTACIESLESASKQIEQRKTPIDAYLFMIKYLLIIREQITPFHIDQSIKEVYLDFAPTKAAVIDLLQKRENLFSLTSNNSLLKLIFEIQPKLNEKIIDSQKQVDGKIKEKCEQFIWFSYDYLTADLSKLMLALMNQPLQQQQPQLQPTIVDDKSNPQDDPNNKNNIELVKLQLKESIKSFLNRKQSLMESMSLYLSNSETEAIIFKQINIKIKELFEQLTRLLQQKLSFTTDLIQELISV